MGKAARPVTFSLLIILLVYLPLMALEGVEGRMFKPMAITVALALGGALLFSLTAFPALAATVLGAARKPHGEYDGLFGRARRRYERLLDAAAGRAAGRCWPSRRRRSSATALVATTLGAEFVPRLDEGELSLDVKRLPSISITEAQRLGVQVEEVLARFPEVQVGRDAHRARRGGDRSGRPRRDRGDGQAAPKEEWTSAARPRRSRRGDQAARSRARCRRRSCRCRSRSRIASTSCWPARAPTS